MSALPPATSPLDEDDRSAAATMLQATNGLSLLADIWRESGPRTEDEYGTKDEGNKVPQPSSAATALRTPVAMKTVPSTTATISWRRSLSSACWGVRNRPCWERRFVQLDPLPIDALTLAPRSASSVRRGF